MNRKWDPNYCGNSLLLRKRSSLDLFFQSLLIKWSGYLKFDSTVLEVQALESYYNFLLLNQISKVRIIWSADFEERDPERIFFPSSVNSVRCARVGLGALRWMCKLINKTYHTNAVNLPPSWTPLGIRHGLATASFHHASFFSLKSFGLILFLNIQILLLLYAFFKHSLLWSLAKIWFTKKQ